MSRVSRCSPHPYQLLDEGKNDMHVIKNLCKKYNLKEDIFTIDAPEEYNEEGIENLLKRLPLKIKESGRKTLGIVVDADENITSRWQSIRDLLTRSGYSDIPVHPPSNGYINSKVYANFPPPLIGVWVMPNNQLPGMLEDFVTWLIPPNDQLLVIARKTLDDIEDKKLDLYSGPSRCKALIHTWLAWQQEPGRPMGAAITNKALNYDSAEALAFVAWLKRLFIE